MIDICSEIVQELRDKHQLFAYIRFEFFDLFARS